MELWILFRGDNGYSGLTENNMAGIVQDLTDSTFDATVKTGVTLVDFWAPWCPPCRMQGPIVEKIAGNVGGRAVVAKVNVDEQGESAAKYGVSNIPTIVILKDGKEVSRFVGLQSEDTLRAGLDAACGL